MSVRSVFIVAAATLLGNVDAVPYARRQMQSCNCKTQSCGGTSQCPSGQACEFLGGMSTKGHCVASMPACSTIKDVAAFCQHNGANGLRTHNFKCANDPCKATGANDNSDDARKCCRAASCASIPAAEVAAFCRDNGANGLVANAGSVICHRGRHPSSSCAKASDAITCCRAPTTCVLHVGMGALSLAEMAAAHNSVKSSSFEQHKKHMRAMKAARKAADMHYSFFKVDGIQPVSSVNVNLYPGSTDKFDDTPVCTAAFQRLDSGLDACGVTVATRSMNVTRSHGRTTVNVTLVCPGKMTSAASVLAACVTPCMHNLNVKCCMVPKIMASLFPCCRELHCCPDQQPTGAASGHRRSLRARGGGGGVRAAPAVSVAVGVEVRRRAFHPRAFVSSRCTRTRAHADTYWSVYMR